jgi:hypothetical protein
MAVLRAKLYDPAVAVVKATTGPLAMTALDTANLRNTFVVPFSGDVIVRLRCVVHGATTYPQILLGVMEGTEVIGRASPHGSLKGTALATAQLVQEVSFCVTGLTRGEVKQWDAAYGVEVGVAATGIKYGGPNDTTADNAFGGFVFEIWRA